MKKHVTMLLVAAMLLTSLTACGETAEPETDAAVDTAAETEPVETELTDSLPEKDFGDRTIRVLTAAEQWQHFYVNEQTGDVVDDAIYNRNLTVEERFGVVLEYDVKNGYMAGMADVKTALSGSVMSGGSDYDLMVGSSSYVMPNVADKLLTDLYELDYLDLNAPWWLQHINAEAEIGNKLYFGAGYYGMLNIAWGVVTFFNKALVTDYSLEDPYELVLDGKWTMDTMLEMCEAVVTDVNGDSKFDDQNDVLGILSSDDYMPSLAISMGHVYSDRNADGSVTVKNADDRIVSINEKIVGIRNSNFYSSVAHDTYYENLKNAFSDNHGLFLIHRLEHADSEQFRNMEGYGIIPCVKYDESQQDYITYVIAENAGIPSVVTDMEASSIILEALQFESWKTVRPAYYDIMLKQKYSSDEISGQMLDIIFEHNTSQFLYMYCRFIDDYPGSQIGINENYTSWLQSKITSMQQKLDDLMIKLQED